MIVIHYNSWSERFKQPFGAIQVGALIDFWIHVSEAAEVSLIMQKEAVPHKEILPMRRLTKERYHCQWKPEQGSGLYFYYFQVDCPGQAPIFYGADQGGEGVCCQSEDQTPLYQLTCFDQSEPVLDWYRNGVVYQIFPDRFFNGNPDRLINAPKENSFIYGRETDDPMYIRDKENNVVRWDFFGGNLAGITQKIPYLKELGITALYLNPIFEACSNHRYDTNDYFKIDPILGTEEEFKKMVDALHESGISVILDGVFSHVGRNSRYFNQAGIYGEKTGAARDPESPYFPWFTFTDYPSQYKSWWGVADLPEINKEEPCFQEFIYGEENSVLKKWTDLGVDGWRLDVADELPDPFIEGIRACLNQYSDKLLIGEVWEDASNKIAYEKRRRYVFGDSLNGVMNYPLRNQVIDLLKNQRSFETISREIVQYQENYPREFYYNQLNNIGTHDTERILSVFDGSKSAVNQAWGFLFMMPGIPCIYYGDEAGLTGGKDPENRRFFPWNSIDSELFTDCQTWIERRKHSSAMRAGNCYPFYSEEQQLFGLLRCDENEQVVYVMNRSETTQSINFDTFTGPTLSKEVRRGLAELLKNQSIGEKQDLFLTSSRSLEEY
ncbi:alpha-amylase [Enterococcus florum]|uniref:Alpha-amylase n=1 Tax=Enterococcus florum TaxID=2480627 RepID=A0A4P5PRN7_9ENTE|nr:glycoside hydrolase family 13 protein [Enterococcus florum]GCF95423.1 alpha-amylase [Enterococcus florum]